MQQSAPTSHGQLLRVARKSQEVAGQATLASQGAYRRLDPEPQEGGQQHQGDGHRSPRERDP
eukprot:4947717-Lingulodinium_polyedra.AAC.1